MTDVWVKATEYGDRNGVTLVRYASIGGMELDAWVASNDVTPRADGAAPDESRLRAACEATIEYLREQNDQRAWLIKYNLRAALAATEPAETCDACRWCWHGTAHQYQVRRCTHPNSVIRDMEYAMPACRWFERWPG